MRPTPSKAEKIDTARMGKTFFNMPVRVGIIGLAAEPVNLSRLHLRLVASIIWGVSHLIG